MRKAKQKSDEVNQANESMSPGLHQVKVLLSIQRVMDRQWKIAGINFDFRHMDHLLAYAHAAGNAEICGVWHSQPDEMNDVIRTCNLAPEKVYSDWRECIEKSEPDLVITCPATRDHALWVGRILDYGKHVLLEKPFASNLKEADALIARSREVGVELAVNWPLVWYPPHRTAKRLLAEGHIGELQEVHFYDGNRGPILDRSRKNPPEPGLEEKRAHWYYDRIGGGSLLDYLGYGAVLATWFWNGAKPTEIMTMAGGDSRLEVDEQSVTLARYGDWISTFHTRWGTLTDPWEFQTQPKCGFVLKGSEGSIANFDYEDQVRLATRSCPQGRSLPVDSLRSPESNPVEYMLNCLETEQPMQGPLSLEYNRIGQQIVDSAVKSMHERRTVRLVE